MRPPVDDGVILLTGASSGIGAEMAKILAVRASGLALVARREALLQELAQTLRERKPGLIVTVHPCDLADPVARAEMVDAVEAAHGRIDVLINNAGLGDIGVFGDSDWKKNQLMIDVNITALLYLTHRVLPDMLKRGKGGILNISSGFGLTWMPLLSAYVGSKHFVTGFSESLRAELHGTGVVVTQVCPGPVATEFEQVAGNPTGQSVPGIVELTAEQCAVSAINGFSRGRAMVVPGFVPSIMIGLGRLSPAWLLRLIYAPLAAVMRRRIQADSSAK